MMGLKLNLRVSFHHVCIVEREMMMLLYVTHLGGILLEECHLNFIDNILRINVSII